MPPARPGASATRARSPTRCAPCSSTWDPCHPGRDDPAVRALAEEALSLLDDGEAHWRSRLLGVLARPARPRVGARPGPTARVGVGGGGAPQRRPDGPGAHHPDAPLPARPGRLRGEARHAGGGACDRRTAGRGPRDPAGRVPDRPRAPRPRRLRRHVAVPPDGPRERRGRGRRAPDRVPARGARRRPPPRHQPAATRFTTRPDAWTWPRSTPGRCSSCSTCGEPSRAHVSSSPSPPARRSCTRRRGRSSPSAGSRSSSWTRWRCPCEDVRAVGFGSLHRGMTRVFSLALWGEVVARRR